MTRRAILLLFSSFFIVAAAAAAPNWGPPHDLGCIGGKRRYEARLWNVPLWRSWDEACRNTPNTIGGQSFATPTACQNRGLFGGEWGIFDVTDASCAASTGRLTDGHLYREWSDSSVYLLSQGRKIRIPTTAALTAMGYSRSQVTIAPNGKLDGYTRVDIPSRTPTPGSLVYPPTGAHHALKVVPDAVKLQSRGKDVELVELFGWLRRIEGGCGDGEDFSYGLELDTQWASSRGIDLNRIFRVGNVAWEGMRLAGFSARRAVSLPLIKLELDTWGRSSLPASLPRPGDWNGQGPCTCKPDGRTCRTWPFPPLHPDPAHPPLAPTEGSLDVRGPYVRVAGSLITDSPHDVQHRLGTMFSRHFRVSWSDVGEWEGAVPDWHPGVNSDEEHHYARWTELHPPDLIEVLPPKESDVTLRGVALAARTSETFGVIGSCEEVDFDMAPAGPRPANSTIAYEELRGPETRFPWGENADNGSWVTVHNDRINVRARVCGGSIGGSPGRFKALYRVWWKSLGNPPQSPPATSPARYVAVWTPRRDGEIQVYDWTYDDYRRKYDELWPQGWRLKWLSTRVADGRTRYTAVWAPGNDDEIQVYDWRFADYRARYDQLWPEGWRLKLLTTNVVDGEVRYTAVWRRSHDGEIQLYGAPYDAYRAKYDSLWSQGWRLKLLTIHVLHGQPRYTAVWQPGTEGEIQVYGYTYAAYRAKYDQLWQQGWRLKLICPYIDGNQVLYTAVWRPSTDNEIQAYGWTYGDLRAKYDELWPQGWRLAFLQVY